MSSSWDLIYKCRRCGCEITRGGLIGDIVRNEHMFDEQKAVHACDDTHVGICDLVGFQGDGAVIYKQLDERREAEKQ